MSEWLDRFQQSHPSVSWRTHDPKFGLVFVRGEGSRLWDTGGQDFIDLTCGYSASSFGQAFPPLVAAATRQLCQLTHVTGDPHVGRIALAEQLLHMFAGAEHPSKVLFNVTGARAVETAWKAAVAFRPGKIVTLGPCFHGRSIAASALGQSPAAQLPHRHLTAEVQVMPPDEYPYCAACPWSLEYPHCNLKCVQDLLHRIGENADELSAVIVEPAIGARGYIFPPAEFFRQLREVTESQGVLMIADEIQTGLGRCGHLSLAAGQGWRPDLLILGKSLAGGIAPISAVLGRTDVLESLPTGSESETFAASPLATAVALEVLSQLRDGPWIERGRQLGSALREFARSEVSRLRWTNCSVEGEGACCVLEFCRAGAGTQAASAANRCAQFVRECVHHRVLPHLSGPNGNRCVWLPALTMSSAEQAATFSRLRAAFAAVGTIHATDKVAENPY